MATDKCWTAGFSTRDLDFGLEMASDVKCYALEFRGARTVELTDPV